MDGVSIGYLPGHLPNNFHSWKNNGGSLATSESCTLNIGQPATRKGGLLPKTR